VLRCRLCSYWPVLHWLLEPETVALHKTDKARRRALSTTRTGRLACISTYMWQATHSQGPSQGCPACPRNLDRRCANGRTSVLYPPVHPCAECRVMDGVGRIFTADRPQAFRLLIQARCNAFCRHCRPCMQAAHLRTNLLMYCTCSCTDDNLHKPCQ
jgi:hypothetical protein